MNRTKSGIALCMAVLALTSCAQAEPPVTKPDGSYYALTVSFGADANTLLLGTCPTGAEDSRDCRVEILDLAKNRSVAFTAPAGRYLQMPSLAADGKHILAVATAITADDTGNRAATIVRFDPAMPERAEVVVDSPTELLMPSETKWGFAAWTKKCQAATQRYCPKNPLVRLPGQAAPTKLSYSYDFISTGLIFIKDGLTLADAEYPPSFDLDSPSIIDVENRNNIWYLTGSGDTGSRRITQAGLAGVTMAEHAEGGLHIIAENRDGLGMFSEENGAFRRIADYPTIAGQGTITSFAVAKSGKRSAGVVLYPRHLADKTKLIVANDPREWTSVGLPGAVVIQQIKIASKGGL